MKPRLDAGFGEPLVPVLNLFGEDLLPTLKEAAKSQGVTVNTLPRRIQKEYRAMLGGRIPAWMIGECYHEWLTVHQAA